MTPNTFDAMFPTRAVVAAHGVIKTSVEDFQVTELAPEITFSGSGEHLWLWVRKTDTNTDWAARCLAEACGVSSNQVGYAGLKDRHAITWQWFSVQLPLEHDIDRIQAALPDEIQIEQAQWHNKKLKTGFLKGNHFRISIKAIEGDKDSVEHNLGSILKQGVPNYFGPQRFGNDLSNIAKAKDLFSGRFKTRNKNLKGMLLSTARSHIFNDIIKWRIEHTCWDRVIEGDVMGLSGSKAWFHAHEESPEVLAARLQQGDVHITAALWGEDPVQSTLQCAEMEQSMADAVPEYQAGLKQFRAKQDRRPIRLMPENLTWQWPIPSDKNELILSFDLPAGSYATAVLREVLQAKDHNR